MSTPIDEIRISLTRNGEEVGWVRCRFYRDQAAKVIGHFIKDEEVASFFERHRRENPLRISTAGGAFAPSDPTAYYATVLVVLEHIKRCVAGFDYEVPKAEGDSVIHVQYVDNKGRARNKTVKDSAKLP